jgi:hypothetical protein
MAELTYSELYPFFDEGDYLALNPDVREAVQRGVFESGLAHLIQFGQFENRVTTFTGTAGNDLIRGFGEARYFYPTSYELVSDDPYDYAVIGTGTGERDTLVGADGTDHYALAAYTSASTPTAVQFYVGQGNSDYALITNFGFAEDSLELAGTPADYTQEVTNGNLLIYQKSSRDLVAVLEGVTAPLTQVDRPSIGDPAGGGTFYLGAVNNFAEKDYLASNPDVRAAVDQGLFKYGYEHFVRYGQYENRVATFVGTTGNDRIEGFGQARYLYATPYEVISADPYDTAVIGTGTGEIDTLIGASGPDNYSTAAYITPSTPNAVQLYLGQGNSDYALIRNFERGVDVIEVAGTINDFTQEVSGSNLAIYRNGSTRDLVAVVEGVTAPLTQVESAVFSAGVAEGTGTIFLG